jgi:hypothetical protein
MCAFHIGVEIKVLVFAHKKYLIFNFTSNCAQKSLQNGLRFCCAECVNNLFLTITKSYFANTFTKMQKQKLSFGHYFTSYS